MSKQAQRLLIALKSPQQVQADPRPRCQECGGVLVRADYYNYWDGRDPHYEGCIPWGESVTPRVCIDCAEKPG